MATSSRTLAADQIVNLKSTLGLQAGQKYELYNAGMFTISLISRTATPAAGSRGRPLRPDHFTILEIDADENLYVRADGGVSVIIVNDA